MIIYLGADHKGFELKEQLKVFLKNEGYEVVDKGNTVQDENDDYSEFGAAVASEVGNDPTGSRGILACGSGVGMDVVANKFAGVRSALALSGDQVFEARQDDDVNVLTFAADFTAPEDAQKIALTFLVTPFDRKERHARRLEKIAELENR